MTSYIETIGPYIQKIVSSIELIRSSIGLIRSYNEEALCGVEILMTELASWLFWRGGRLG
jgi:hypothetical protein